MQDGDCQYQTKAVLYMVEGSSTDVILGMESVKWYDPLICWVDSMVGMPNLLQNDGMC